MALEGKVALVTGSTSGIGLGIARALADDGASLMMNGFGDRGDIELLRARIAEECGVRVAFDGADLSRREEVGRLIDHTAEVLGSVDILVNNAGIQFVAPIEDFPDDRWEAIMDLNLSAAFYSMKAAIPSRPSSLRRHAVKASAARRIRSSRSIAATSNSSALVMALACGPQRPTSASNRCTVSAARSGLSQW